RHQMCSKTIIGKYLRLQLSAHPAFAVTVRAIGSTTRTAPATGLITNSLMSTARCGSRLVSGAVVNDGKDPSWADGESGESESRLTVLGTDQLWPIASVTGDVGRVTPRYSGAVPRLPLVVSRNRSYVGKRACSVTGALAKLTADSVTLPLPLTP